MRVYINDIVIYNCIKEEYLEYVSTVLTLFNKNRIYISANKFFTAYPSV